LQKQKKEDFKIMMNKDSKIFIAGNTGMVGSAIHRNLILKGYSNFVFAAIENIDLTRQLDVEVFFEKEKPEYVIDAAAKVGGILANNTYRAQFIYENLSIQNNIIHCAYKYGVKKLLFLGSSCIYPKLAPQPLKEEYLLTGVLEQTNEPYAIAKITGIKMCENYYKQYGSDFFSVMPTNLYGPNDNYDLEKSHVLPAIIRKMHLGKCLGNNDWLALRNDLDKKPIEGINGSANDNEIKNILAKYGIRINSSEVIITLWGTGNVYREFLHVDDMAEACVYIMENINADTLIKTEGVSFLNIGTGLDITINELALLVQKIIGYKGSINWDSSKPDGTPKKLLDVSKLHKAGFKHKYTLEEGIRMVYKEYIK
jgi:GDP-L-fucose synthase